MTAHRLSEAQRRAISVMARAGGARPLFAAERQTLWSLQTRGLAVSDGQTWRLSDEGRELAAEILRAPIRRRP